MKRVIPVVVALAVAVGASLIVLRFAGGCGTPQTRIAQRKLYEGPTTLPAGTTEWPKWLGPLGDGISRETNLAATWPKDGPPELWSAEVGLGYASPVAAGGRVYLFSMNNNREALTCFDANSGRILWSEEGGKGRTSSYPGTRATPAIDGADIVTLGGAGELTCRDVASGQQNWVTNILDATGATAQDWGTASTPLVSGNLVFVQVGQGGPVALAIDRATGKIAWRSQAVGIAGYAHPVLADVEGSKQLIVFGGKAVYGMDPSTGETMWEHPHATSYDVNASTPVYRDGRLFVTSAYGTGATMLKISASGPPQVLWQSKQAQSRFQPAILDDGALYVNAEGKFMCLDWERGVARWQDDDNKIRLGIGGSFVLLDGGDRMIALGERGVLHLARLKPDGVEAVSTAPMLDGAQIWASPLIYGGRLYLKGEQDLICYDIAGANTATQPAVE